MPWSVVKVKFVGPSKTVPPKDKGPLVLATCTPLPLLVVTGLLVLPVLDWLLPVVTGEVAPWVDTAPAPVTLLTGWFAVVLLLLLSKQSNIRCKRI